jgi:hypothetical protein
MSTFSFNITNSKEWFDKLEREYNDFLKDKTSSDRAINFSITAHHMNEWAKSELTDKEKSELALKRKALQNDFNIIQDLANGTKHKVLKYESTIKTTEHSRGAYSSGYSRGFNISTLNILMNSGEKIYFEDIAQNIYNFWKDYFN